MVIFVLTGGIGGCRCQQKTEPDRSLDAQVAPRNGMVYRRYSDAAAALTDIVTAESPTIIGFGEYHQQNETVAIRSALKRFTEEMLPVLNGRATDLIVETWISTGRCGADETSLTKEVEVITKRPAETENETVALIRTAAALGIKPHVLTLSCDDYEGLLDDAGVDYFGLLALVGERLGATAKGVYTMRRGKGLEEGSDIDGIVTIFGGAIHNDALPSEMWRSVSYGPLLRRIDRKYMEIDLVVPEFAMQSEIARGEQWFHFVEKNASPREVTLIETAPRAYVLILKKGR